jgi:hypothetical protein
MSRTRSLYIWHKTHAYTQFSRHVSPKCIRTYMCVCIYIYIYTHTHTHSIYHAHTYTHTQTAFSMHASRGFFRRMFGVHFTTSGRWLRSEQWRQRVVFDSATTSATSVVSLAHALGRRHQHGIPPCARAPAATLPRPPVRQEIRPHHAVPYTPPTPKCTGVFFPRAFV